LCSSAVSKFSATLADSMASIRRRCKGGAGASGSDASRPCRRCSRKGGWCPVRASHPVHG
jgi:hypothetical protein